MFGFLKKAIHEPLNLQHADAGRSGLGPQILAGADCDEVLGAHGPFGSVTNPIPVNGSIGELKYLGKLRGHTGQALLFHRIGSGSSPVAKQSVDHYEVVCLDGTQWNDLYFDLYHPRRSNLAPPGYTLTPYEKDLKEDLPFAFGSNGLVSNFPHGLPDAVVKLYGPSMGGTLARKIKERLSQHNFARPARQQQSLTAHILDPQQGYRSEPWVVGKDIQQQVALTFAESGNLFVVVVYEAGTAKVNLCSRAVWEQVSASFEAIDRSGSNALRRALDELNKLKG